LNPAGSIAPATRQRLVTLARVEPDAEVRSELASTTARLEPDAALAVLQELIRREDVLDKHVPLRIWWALEERITRDADAVLSWLEKAALWQAPLFTEHLAGRIARRLAADRGDTPSYTRVDPESNWKQYAWHPRSRMPGGKGDYTEWVTNYTPGVSDRNLTRLARLLEMAPASHRDRLLAGAHAGLEQGAPAQRMPQRLMAFMGTSGKPDQPNRPRAATLTAERGRNEYLTYCAPCHQTDGSGMTRLATPLRNSKWVLGPEDLLGRIVLNGLRGDMLMPALGTLDDQQLSAILTYVRGAWGHAAGPVSPETVGRIRTASQGRDVPWTATELSALGRGR
jgi:mono/diheme cytochrome c family protein